MIRISYALLLLTILLNSISTSICADEAEPWVDASPQDITKFAGGNTLYVLLHEIGHVLINDLNIPLLGLEEESADTLATMILIRTDESTRDRSEPKLKMAELLIWSALGNLLTWNSGLEKEHQEVIIWAQHGLSIQRFNRAACLLYGSDPQKYGVIYTMTNMPDLRADVCEDEFSTASHAFEWVIDSYGDKRNPDNPAMRNNISISYTPPMNKMQERIIAVLKEGMYIEKTVDELDKYFVLPGSIDILVQSCDYPNAYWDLDERELVLCYELIESYAKMGDSPEVTRLGNWFREHP